MHQLAVNVERQKGLHVAVACYAHASESASTAMKSAEDFTRSCGRVEQALWPENRALSVKPPSKCCAVGRSSASMNSPAFFDPADRFCRPMYLPTFG